MRRSRSCRRSSTSRSDSGNRKYIIIARRIISGLLWEHLKGSRFVMAGGYGPALPAFTGFLLTGPSDSTSTRYRDRCTRDVGSFIAQEPEYGVRDLVGRADPVLGHVRLQPIESINTTR